MINEDILTVFLNIYRYIVVSISSSELYGVISGYILLSLRHFITNVRIQVACK